MRCIKPNNKASGNSEDFDENVVADQLRAGSILEAVRIRKLGYGYRIGYQEFADKFWPICGELIFEADREHIRIICEKAAEFVGKEEA